MGSKSPTQTTTTNTPPPQVLAQYQAATTKANAAAATPYTPYTNELVAPVNQEQNTGISGVNSSANSAQPYLTGAAGLTLAGAAPANAQQFSSAALDQYMSPYTQDVVNTTQAAFNNQNTQQAQQLTGNEIGAGAFGGDRAGVAQGILAGQQQTAEAPVIAGLENQNYTQALGEFNTQQTTNLSAQQANLARLGSAGLQLGNIGTAAQTAGLQGAGAQLQAGTLQQQTQQAADTAAYNQFLQQQAYPFQTAQFQANIAEGIGSNSGGTSTSSTSAPSSVAPYIGAGLGLLALSPSGSTTTSAHGGRIWPKYATGGLVIDARHRFAGGGAAGGGGLVIPYASNEQNVDSWVPQTSAPPLGHTMPTAQTPANSNNQTAQNLGLIGSGLKALGNSGIGDAISDFAQDALPGLSFADGGLVLRRRRYDSGGSASPYSADELLAASGNSSAGDALGAYDQDVLGFARGGLALRRPGYDGGGLTTGLAYGDPSPYGALVDVSPQAQQAQALAASGAPLPPPRPAGLVAPPSNSLDTATVAPAPPAPTGQPIQSPGAGGLTTSGLNPDARGMRNNNPGNLESNAWTSSLPGYAGTDGRFAIFSSPQQGMAALDRNLQGYGDKGISTPLQIASTWAPASDNNDPVSYGSTIARSLGVGLNDKVDLSDPSVRAKVGQAIGLVENGVSRGAPSSATAYAANGTPGGLGGGNAFAGVSPGAGLTLGSGAASSATPGPAAPANAAPQQSGGLFGLHLSDPVRAGLLSAGLGIMASPSRNLAMAIGQGGQQGVMTYEKALDQVRQQSLTKAEIANYQSEIGARSSDAQQRAAALYLQGESISRTVNAGRAVAGLPPDPNAGGLGDFLTTWGQKAGITPSVGGPAPSLGSVGAGLAAIPSQPGGAAVSSGAGAQPSRGGVAQAPGGSGPIPGVPPMEDPFTLNQNAQRAAALGDTAAATQLMTKAQNIITRGTVWQNGKLVPIPGFLESQAAIEGAKTSASEAAKAPYDLVEVQPSAGGPTQLVPKSSLVGGQAQQGTVVGVGAGSPPGSKMDAAADANPIIKSQPAFNAKRQDLIATDENEMMQQYQTRQLSRQRLQALQGIMQTYQPGAFAEQKADLVAGLRGVGIPVPDTATANPAAFQEFIKNATANVFNDVKGMGGRVLVSEIQGLTKANANPELQPAAAAAIIGQGLGALNYEDQHTKDYFAWKKQNPNAVSTADFELPWAEAHPVAQYVDQATKGIAYSGQAVPPPQGRTVGQTYMTPKGPAVWRGSGWQLQTAAP